MQTQTLNILRRLLLVMPGIILQGCETLPDDNAMNIRTGDTFRLSQAVEFPNNKLMLTLQHGRIIDETSIDYYAARCLISLPSPVPNAQKIPPGNYVIKQFSQSSEMSTSDPGYIAQPGSKYTNYVTRLLLTSASQYELQSVTCLRLAERFGGAYLTLAEINEALGNIAQIVVLERKPVPKN